MTGAMAAVESTLPVVGKSSGGVFAYFFFILKERLQQVHVEF